MIFRSEQLRIVSRVACALAMVAATSCSPVTKVWLGNRFWPCLTDNEAELILPMFETAADATAAGKGNPPDSTTLIEESCRRRVYERNGHDFEVVKSWGTLAGNSTAHGPARSGEDSMKCLNQAVEDVGGLRFADGDTIVKTYRERHP